MAPEFELSPLPAKLRSNGWLERRTGLSFEWYHVRPEDWGGPDQLFELFVKHKDLPRSFLAMASFRQIGISRRPHIVAKYRVSRTDILRKLNEVGRAAFAANQVAQLLGGRDSFVGLCLKGARACHRVYRSLSDTEAAVRDEANFVEFELTD